MFGAGFQTKMAGKAHEYWGIPKIFLRSSRQIRARLWQKVFPFITKLACESA
jgi:hypothetical protein